tara:strand:+ start:23 stop:604 length:582 start_codon:yes stop_codon:yes gene_type:complete
MATRKRQDKLSTKKAIPTSQLENRSFLIPNSFGFTIERAPTVGFFGSIINVPGFTLGVAAQPTYLKEIPRPGEILNFEDLTLNFMVDEGLQNYLEIDKWMRGLGFPEDIKQIYDLQDDATVDSVGLNIYSDATLTIYNNQSQPAFRVKFKDIFPYYLSPLEFNAQMPEAEVLTCQVAFKYSIYTIEPGSGGCC